MFRSTNRSKNRTNLSPAHPRQALIQLTKEPLHPSSDFRMLKQVSAMKTTEHLCEIAERKKQARKNNPSVSMAPKVPRLQDEDIKAMLQKYPKKASELA